jgi:hypothetical protein
MSENERGCVPWIDCPVCEHTADQDSGDFAFHPTSMDGSYFNICHCTKCGNFWVHSDTLKHIVMVRKLI